MSSIDLVNSTWLHGTRLDSIELMGRHTVTRLQHETVQLQDERGDSIINRSQLRFQKIIIHPQITSPLLCSHQEINAEKQEIKTI